jgi:hypothetical protein
MIAGEFVDVDTVDAENTRLFAAQTADDAQTHVSSITLEDALTYG